MKTSMKWIIYGASLGLMTGTCMANGSSSTQEKAASTKEPSSKMQAGYVRTREFFDAKSLIGTEIMNEQKENLGDLKDVVFNPQKGETFAAISIGSDRCALVPWQALKISNSTLGKGEVTLNTSKQALDSGPTVKGDDWQELNKRSFAQSIYQHYNLQPPASMGGVTHGALGSHSTGSAKSNNARS